MIFKFINPRIDYRCSTHNLRVCSSHESGPSIERNFSHVFVGSRVGVERVIIISGNVVSESHDTPFLGVTGEVW